MSWLRRKGPSEVEVARENEIKRGITEAVSKALKIVQKENINSEDRAVYSTETANAVCSSLEAVFLHGLRASSVTKIANFVGLGQQDRTAEQSLNFWQFVSKFTHGEVISQLKHLGQITTEIGLCRAWVRLALNDCLMESYVDAMTSDKKTLEYFYHRTCYLRDQEQPGILKSYLQGLMAFEFKLSYNSSVLNEWSYTPLILAGIMDSDDSPLPVIKPSANKTMKKEPSFHENTTVEVDRLRTHSRGSLEGKDRRSKLSNKETTNPMENPRLGQPSDNAYYVTASNFTAQDVEEFKRLAQTKSAKSHSECSSSSQVSAPDPPHLNLSPSDYVQRGCRSRSHSDRSSSTKKSKDFGETEKEESKLLKEALNDDDLGQFKIDLMEEQVQPRGDLSDCDREARKLTNKYKPPDKESGRQKYKSAEKAFIESLPQLNKVSEDFLEQLYSDVNSDVVDSKVKVDSEISQDPDELKHDSYDSYKEYKNYSSVRRLESINAEVKEDAILHDILSEDSPTKTDNVDNIEYNEMRNNVSKENESIDCIQNANVSDIIEAFGERIDLNGRSDVSKQAELKESPHLIAIDNQELSQNENDTGVLHLSKEYNDKQPSPLTESNLRQLNEELNSISGHIEEKIDVDVDAAVKEEKTQSSQKRKSEKRRQSKGHLKPDFSPPKSEPLKPELSPAKAERIDTFQYNSEKLSNHRLSLPTSSLLTKSPTVLGSHRQSLPNILEAYPEIGHPISSSYDTSERFQEIYDGKPIDDEGEGEVDDTVNEDDLPVISNEHRQSVGNSLMLSGRGWSSSFESEMNDTIEPLSPTRTDNALPITTRPKAESFGSLLQNYTPSSSLSAPSIDDVLHNFPRTETIISPPPDPLPTRPPLKQESIEGFEIVTDADNPDSNLVARLTQLSEIANEKGLDAQNFQCKGCTRPLGLIFGKPRVCAYDGGYYCFECHENDEYYIPARIVHNWDFRKHKVAKKNLEFLQEVEEQPHIDIEEANPRLYDHVTELQEIKKLRTQLVYLKTYLFTCKQSTAEDFTRLIWPRDYLFESLELYSLADLLQIPTGVLATSLRKVIKFATKHVYSCRLCSQKGFICELCNNSKVIYAFEMDATYRCPQCRSVYHRECKTDNRPCPKCQRRLLREAANDLEPSSHDLASQYLHTR